MRGWLSKPGENWWRGETGVKAGYRVLIFFALTYLVPRTFGVFFGLLAHMVAIQHNTTLPAHHLTPQMLQDRKYITSIAIAFVVALVELVTISLSVLIISWLEGKTVSSYFLSQKKRFKFFVFGFVCASAVTLPFAVLLHFIHKNQPYIDPSTIVIGVFLALISCLMIGFSEELMFRGYIQKTLDSAIGFWPALVISSVLFGAVHMSNLSAAMVIHHPFIAFGYVFEHACTGVLLCVGLRQMGTLWWPIGFHAAWDFVLLIATAKSGFDVTNPLQHIHEMHSGLMVLGLIFIVSGLPQLLLAALLVRVKRAPRVALAQNAA